MLRGIRRTLAVAGVAILAGGGASIFWHPAHEVLYTASRSPVTCYRDGCLALYQLEVGNTGRAMQPDVRLRLRAAVLPATLPPQVRDFGKVDRPVAVSEADGVRTYALGPLPPDQRVVLSFALLRPEPAAFPSWDDILVGVVAAEGTARPGHPAWTTLLRIWYALAHPF